MLNLDSRLAQRVLVAGRRRRPTATRTTSTRSPAASPGQTGSRRAQTLRVDSHRAAQPAEEPELRRAARSRTPSATACATSTASGRTSTRSGPTCASSLHLGAERATLYVDTSGEPLFKRGWREDKGEAPLKETLAAAMLAAAGWRGTPSDGGALHDPCCGSGHDRDRGGADRLRHRARAGCAASRSSGCCRSPTPSVRAELQRLQAEGRGARARAAGADLRQRRRRSAWSTSRAAMPSAPASPTRSTSTAATRSSGRRRRCRPTCPAR